MPLYMFQGSYSSGAIKGMIENPQDRAEVVKPMIEALGGKLHALYFCMGKDDVVAIIEAPDDTAVGAMSMTVGASGSMTSGRTTKLITSQEAMASMEAAGKAAGLYKPAG